MNPAQIVAVKINNYKVKPVIANSGEPDPADIRGSELFTTLYSNVFICAKKNSGKTNLLFNMLKSCTNNLSKSPRAPPTKVYLISGSINHDKTYAEIKNMLDQRGIEYIPLDHFDGEEGNVLDEVLADEDEGDEPAEEPRWATRQHEYIDERGLIISEQIRVPLPPKAKRTAGKMAPKIIVSLDDLGRDLRHPSVARLLKVNRHHLMKTFISSQWIHDLEPQAIKQLDYVILFNSMNDEKLAAMRDSLDLSITQEQFKRLYKFATEAPWSFLFIDVRRGLYRKNFDEQLTIE